MPSKLEFTRRATLLPPIVPAARPDIGGIAPDLLGFELPLIPLMRLEESLAEKLARFRRVIRSRDVYDLAEMGHLVRAQLDLVRQILRFKVYLDIVRDGRESTVPFWGGPEFVGRTVAEIIDPGDLGLILGGRVDYGPMLERIRDDFGPMGVPVGAVETRLATVNRGDLYWAEGEYRRLRTEYRASPPEGDRGFGSS